MKKKKLIQSIQRASDILDLFIQEKRALGVTDFSTRMDLPKTTVSSIVQTLLELRYLERDPLTSRYRLGPKLFQLGMKYATNMDLVLVARAWMERLCFQFRQPVNVGMMVGDKAVVVLRVEPENRLMVFPQAGSVIPFHTSAIGKVLFAHLSPEKRGAILDGYDFQRLTERTIGNADDFIAELGRVRREGIAFDDQESVTGLTCVGAPIYNNRGQVIAAFSVTGKSENIERQRERIINVMRYAGTQISAQMGYRSAALG